MTTTGITIRDLEKLPAQEGWRYEVIEGELYVTTQPSREHQRVCVRLTTVLETWDAQAELGETMYAPGVIFTEEDAVAPDVVWVRRERLGELLDDAGHLHGAPDLVIEVLSPGRANRMRDREAKLDLFSRHAVPEYWIVDPQQREVAVHRRGASGLEPAETLGRADVVTSPRLPGFACPVAGLFPPEPLSSPR